jgi:hypothetical protein
MNETSSSCWICFEAGNCSEHGRLLSNICACRGSMMNIHQKCLERNIVTKMIENKDCTLLQSCRHCNQQYDSAIVTRLADELVFGENFVRFDFATQVQICLILANSWIDQEVDRALSAMKNLKIVLTLTQLPSTFNLSIVERNIMYSIACCLLKKGQFDDAVAEFSNLFLLDLHSFGMSEYTLNSAHCIAVAYHNAKCFSNADKIYQIIQKNFSTLSSSISLQNSAQYAKFLENWALTKLNLNDHENATKLAWTSLSITIPIYGATHTVTSLTAERLATILITANDVDALCFARNFFKLQKTTFWKTMPANKQDLFDFVCNFKKKQIKKLDQKLSMKKRKLSEMHAHLYCSEVLERPAKK